MKTLYIVRGVPGSGKTSFVKNITSAINSEDVDHFEADQYFYNEAGDYIFNIDSLHQAHIDCQTNTYNSMYTNVKHIFVSNTFTTEKEMKPYLIMAKEFNYKVICLVVENRHNNISVHNVPQEIVVKMKDRFSLKL